MRFALLLSLVAAVGCAGVPRVDAPDALAGCYALTVTPPARRAWYFEGAAATVELTDETVPWRDSLGVERPSPYVRAQSWPQAWDRTAEPYGRDPVQAWVSTAWRHTEDGWRRDATASPDSIRIGLGPMEIAFGGIAYVARPTRGGLRGRAVWFTDASSDGVFQRSAPLIGERVVCPDVPAYRE